VVASAVRAEAASNEEDTAAYEPWREPYCDDALYDSGDWTACDSIACDRTAFELEGEVEEGSEEGAGFSSSESLNDMVGRGEMVTLVKARLAQ
jgi:hypothetical protein